MIAEIPVLAARTSGTRFLDRAQRRLREVLMGRGRGPVPRVVRDVHEEVGAAGDEASVSAGKTSS